MHEFYCKVIAQSTDLIMKLLPLLADAMAYVSKLGKTDSMKFDLDYNATTGAYTDTTHLNAYVLV